MQNGERRFWWHASKESPRGVRAWFHFGRRTLSIEGHWFKRFSLSASLSFNTFHEGTMLALSIPWLFSFYIGLPIRTGIQDRQISVSFREWTLRIQPWSQSMSWSSRGPRWKHGLRLNIPDFIFGRTTHKSEVVSTHAVIVPMPEKAYPATVTITRDIWRRKRWPFAWIRRTSSWIDIPCGIPHSGKGENSWDCGDDGLFGCGAEEPTCEAAIAAAVKSVLKSRKRYGMPSTVGREHHHLAEATA